MIFAPARSDLFRLIDHGGWDVDPLFASRHREANVLLLSGRLDQANQFQAWLREVVIE
jgi:hypothetical protein